MERTAQFLFKNKQKKTNLTCQQSPLTPNLCPPKKVTKVKKIFHLCGSSSLSVIFLAGSVCLLLQPVKCWFSLFLLTPLRYMWVKLIPVSFGEKLVALSRRRIDAADGISRFFLLLLFELPAKLWLPVNDGRTNCSTLSLVEHQCCLTLSFLQFLLWNLAYFKDLKKGWLHNLF